MAEFGKDPIYRTEVIVRKPVWTKRPLSQLHLNAIFLLPGVIMISIIDIKAARIRILY